jgi:thiol-disulfide isomerase/thioredoxin
MPEACDRKLRLTPDDREAFNHPTMERLERKFPLRQVEVARGRSLARPWGIVAVAAAIAVFVLTGKPTGVRAAIERVGAPAPNFTCAPCLNHAPFKLSDLRGKVVLVDFWEYTCINCIRTFPYLRRWDALYRPLGLVIVGVHTPEFEFGKNPTLVAEATRRFGFDFPVAVDSDYKIWYAFHNEGWPADYLIDKNGSVTYTHVGEGEYGDFEHKIQELLKQANPAIDFSQPKYRIPESENVELGGGVCMRATPETYLGFAHTMNIANPGGEDRTGQAVYATPAEIPLDDFALEGRWLATAEYVRHPAEAKPPGDSVALHYRAKSVYLVAGSDSDSQSRRLYVTQDGHPLSASTRGVDVRAGRDGRTYLELGAKRMYYLVNNREFGGHQLQLYALDPGLSLYSFTFGNNCENKFAHR